METLPQMESATPYITDFIDSFTGDTLSVLEWGSGSSTAYFTRYLKYKGVPFSWVSLEYNKEWFDEVSKSVHGDSRIEIKLFDVGNTQIHQRNTDMEDYILYPSTLDKKFDIIIVDGRKRRRCVEVARKLVAENGMVILHDAFRPYYWSAFGMFPDSRFVSKSVWIGTIKKIPWGDRGRNIVNRLMYQFYNRIHFFLKRIQKRFKIGSPKPTI